MAGEVPKVVPGCARVAGSALAGPPHGVAVHNPMLAVCAVVDGPLPTQVLGTVHTLHCEPHHGISPIRPAQAPANRPRDFWGYGRIEGKVTIEGTPASRRVRLFDARTALVIGETWSRQDGRYWFDFLDPTREYFVLAHDHVKQFNAVVADNVQPAVIDRSKPVAA